MKKYRFIEDLTSDVMFEAYGKTLKELFENSAKAMFTVICQIEKVRPEKSLDLEVKDESPDKLMIAWLSELISLVDLEERFFSKFEILEISDKGLKARIWGEDVSPEKGETVVKAVTYYKYLFKKTKNGYTVRVSLDI